MPIRDLQICVGVPAGGMLSVTAKVGPNHQAPSPVLVEERRWQR